MPTQETNPGPTDQSSPAAGATPAGVPKETVQTLDFVEHHRSALERDEVRHNLILAILDRLAAGQPPGLLRWTLGPPGACAVQTPGYPIVLGELTAAQCRALADETRDLNVTLRCLPPHRSGTCSRGSAASATWQPCTG
jgi:hypothetical protein